MQNLGKHPFPSPSQPQANLEVVEPTIYGEMWAPSTLAEFNLLIEHIATHAGDIQGWRGQSGDWVLDSSAVRRLSRYVAHPAAPGGPVPRDFIGLEDVVRNYEAMLLEQAKVAGHHRREGREWSDLELLALLQHNGAATRLLDFTRNVFVALWFACEDVKHQNEYGVIVGTDLNSVQHHWLRQAETQIPLHQLLDQYSKQDEEHLLIYQPEALFERMRAQQGFFMFGKAMPNPWGSLPAVGNPPADYFYGIPTPSVVLQKR